MKLTGVPARSKTCSAQFVSFERKAGVLRAKLVGPGVGQREAPIIADEIAAQLSSADAGVKTLLLDLKRVQVMSGLGLGLCVELCRQARERGIRTVIRSGRELAGHLRMLKLEKLCTIVGNDKELQIALAA